MNFIKYFILIYFIDFKNNLLATLFRITVKDGCSNGYVVLLYREYSTILILNHNDTDQKNMTCNIFFIFPSSQIIIYSKNLGELKTTMFNFFRKINDA